MSGPSDSQEDMKNKTVELRTSSEARYLSPFAKRCVAWMMLPLLGNMLTGTALLIANQFPPTAGTANVVAAINPYVAPAYAPTLLFFTVILAIFDRNDVTSSSDADTRHSANRMVANTVRMMLVTILSFAIVVVLNDPTSIVHVVFAIALSFIAIVRAELIAPLRQTGTDIALKQAQDSLQLSRERAVEALGPIEMWVPARRVWPTVASCIAAPMLATVVAFVIGALVLWGPGYAFSGMWIILGLASAMGPTAFVLAWFSTANKAEAPTSRRLMGGYLIGVGVAGTAVLAVSYFTALKNTAWMGAVLICVGILSYALTTGKRPDWLLRKRRSVEWKITQSRLKRLEDARDRAQARRDKERVRPRTSVRLISAVIRPFREAYRLASKP